MEENNYFDGKCDICHKKTKVQLVMTNPFVKTRKTESQIRSMLSGGKDGFSPKLCWDCLKITLSRIKNKK